MYDMAARLVAMRAVRIGRVLAYSPALMLPSSALQTFLLLTFQWLERVQYVRLERCSVMLIQELALQAGVAAKTIRYYETIGLLPAAARGPNNYRRYSARDLERLRLIAGARRIGLPLLDVAEIRRARDTGQAPCGHVLAALARHLSDVEHRIADLLSLRTTLAELLAQGTALPQDDVLGEQCVCALLKAFPTSRDAGHESLAHSHD